MPLPERIKTAPELFLGLDLYYRAFLDLTSCRNVGSGSEGPIPWIAILQWAEAYQLSGEQREDLFYHIGVMDDVYLKFKAKKATINPPSLPGPKRKK